MSNSFSQDSPTVSGEAPLLPTVTSMMGDYELLGELGRDDSGTLVYVAKAHPSGRMVAVDVGQEIPPGQSRVSATVRFRRSPPVQTSGTVCGRCGAAAPDDATICSVCGNSPLSLSVAAPAGATAVRLMEAASRDVQEQYDLLGVWSDAGPDGAVLFARDRASRRLVTLGVRPDPSGTGTYLIRAIPPFGGGIAPATPLAKVCPRCGDFFSEELRFCPNDGAALQARHKDESLIGQMVAERYLVQKKLGQGGMGHVYLAEQVKMHRPCALKVISQALLHDVDSLSRFHREAENASRIQHQNVAAIYDFGDASDGRLYLAMEYVDGPTLSTVLRNTPALPIPRAVDITLQVAEALTAAHDLKIIHRDLKPDNIMLGPRRDGGDLVKVVDFGVAKMMEATDQQVTKTGYVIGTPAYMSPEQLSPGTLDGRSDLYSLGLVFFRMLTGKLPFEGEGAQEVMFARLSFAPKTLADARPDVQWPPELQAILDRLVTRLADDRYASAEELANDLARVQFKLIGTTRHPFPGMATPASSVAAVGGGAAGKGRGATARSDASLKPITEGSALRTVPIAPRSRRQALMIGGVALAAGLVIAVVLIVRGSGGGVDGGAVTSAASAGLRADTTASSSSPQARTDSSPSAAAPDPRATAPGAPVAPNRAPASGATPLSEEETQQMLDQLRRWTDPTSGSEGTASRAITQVPRLLPFLRTAADSVAARYYLADAYLLRADAKRACAVLLAIREPARGTRFAAGVENYLSQPDLGCR
jgi:serine/threonine-protein kinase